MLKSENLCQTHPSLPCSPVISQHGQNHNVIKLSELSRCICMEILQGQMLQCCRSQYIRQPAKAPATSIATLTAK